MYLNNLCNLVQTLKVHKHWNAIQCLFIPFCITVSTQSSLLTWVGAEGIHSDSPNFVMKPAKACPHLWQVSDPQGSRSDGSKNLCRLLASLPHGGRRAPTALKGKGPTCKSIWDRWTPALCPGWLIPVLQRLSDDSAVQGCDCHPRPRDDHWSTTGVPSPYVASELAFSAGRETLCVQRCFSIARISDQ